MDFPHQRDAYAKPPDDLRKLYKKYQKHPENLDGHLDIVDFRRGLTAAQQIDVNVIGNITKERLTSTFEAFMLGTHPLDRQQLSTSAAISDAPIYEHRDLPGGVLDGLNLLMTDER